MTQKGHSHKDPDSLQDRVIFHVKPWERLCHKKVHSGKRLHFLWNNLPCLLGRSTLSTPIFNSYETNYRKVVRHFPMVFLGFSQKTLNFHGEISSFFEWEFPDPKMELLYHINPYFGGISPYIGLT